MAYPFTPLSSPNEIRLLILHPSSTGSEIICQLLHSGLHERPYEAVSYEWGLPSEEDPSISIDNHTIRIRKNLFLALEQFRHQHEERVLWIDALCINQDDTSEKGSQVQFMGTIYSTAEMVLVWLGASDENTSLAYNFMHRVSALMSGPGPRVELQEVKLGDELNVRLGNSWLLLEPRFKGYVKLSTEELEAMWRLMERSYWYRVWIVQEICLARKISIFCGNYCISSELMEWTCGAMIASRPQFFSRDKQTRRLWYSQGVDIFYTRLLRIYSSESQTRYGYDNNLLRYLRNCKKSMCTEVRDYVYAFVALAPGCGIVVDYSRDVKELVKQVRRRERETDDPLYTRYGIVSEALRKKFEVEESHWERILRQMRMELDYRFLSPYYRMRSRVRKQGLKAIRR
jgi:hypothetical protein